MREIEQRNFHSAVVSGPKVIDQVATDQWANEYAKMSSVPVISQQANFNEVSCFDYSHCIKIKIRTFAQGSQRLIFLVDKITDYV